MSFSNSPFFSSMSILEYVCVCVSLNWSVCLSVVGVLCVCVCVYVYVIVTQISELPKVNIHNFPNIHSDTHTKLNQNWTKMKPVKTSSTREII